MKEYTVKIKDYKQGTTHTLHEYAGSQDAANLKALRWLRKALDHNDLDIAGVKRKKKKTSYSWTYYREDAVSVPKFNRKDWLARSKQSMDNLLRKYG